MVGGILLTMKVPMCVNFLAFSISAIIGLIALGLTAEKRVSKNEDKCTSNLES
ncbi:MAG: hypothetical protein AAGU75_06280 [Bacillota bacterium]